MFVSYVDLTPPSGIWVACSQFKVKKEVTGTKHMVQLEMVVKGV